MDVSAVLSPDREIDESEGLALVCSSPCIPLQLSAKNNQFVAAQTSVPGAAVLIILLL